MNKSQSVLLNSRKLTPTNNTMNNYIVTDKRLGKGSSATIYLVIMRSKNLKLR